MKKLILIAVILASGQFLMAQQPDSKPDSTILPAYRRFPTIPPFKLLKVDSATYLTKDDIRKHRETIIMFFSPECEHCKHQTEDIIAAMSKFKNIEIVMATYQPFDEMKAFYENYHIASYPNIKMGRDEKFVLPPFYKIMSLPHLALYDKKGNFITFYEGNQKVDTILQAFNPKKTAEQ